MNLQEILGEELFNQVSETLKGKGKDGKDLELAITNNGEWIPREKFNSEKKILEEQIKSRDSQLVELQKAAKGNEDLLETIKNMKKANEDALIDSELKLAFVKNGAEKYFDLLSAKIDKTKFEIAEDGSIKGIDEQLNILKTDYSELFTQQTTQTGRDPVKGEPVVKKDLKEMSMDEYIKFRQGQNK